MSTKQLHDAIRAEIYKGLLPSVLAARGRDRHALIGELKAALVGYWRSIEEPDGSARR